MIAIMGRGERSVIQVRFSRGGDRLPARVGLWLLGRGKPLRLATLEPSRLGLPETYDELLEHEQPPEFRLDEQVLREVAEIMEFAHPRGEPIWIDLDAPRRLTTLVPWERLLAPLELGPILRAPQLPLAPVAPRENPRVALCVNLTEERRPSNPDERARRLRETLTGYAWNGNGEVEVFLYVSPQAASRELDATMESFLDGLAPGVIYVDHGAPGHDHSVPEARPARELGHPWLRRVKRRLAGRRVDRVVMLSEARLFPARAALALGCRDESGEPDTRLVRADELDLFMTQLGAHRLDLRSTSEGWSDLGTRLVADELSWVVPGTVTARDSGNQPSPVAIRYAAEDAPPAWDQRPEVERETLDRFTLARLLEGRASGWVAATQRHLERQLGGLVRDYWTRSAEPSELYIQHRTGIEEAMAFTVETVKEHLDRAALEGRPSEENRDDEEPGEARGMTPG